MLLAMTKNYKISHILISCIKGSQVAIEYITNKSIYILENLNLLKVLLI